jgi:hypothetical protein
MTKKHFIALADYIKAENQSSNLCGISLPFRPRTIYALADFCESQNPNFNRERWLAYISGECGPNGGEVAR